MALKMSLVGSLYMYGESTAPFCNIMQEVHDFEFQTFEFYVFDVRMYNQIHHWFLLNVFAPHDRDINTGKKMLDNSTLEMLDRDLTSAIADPIVAQKNFPPLEGFMFGSTEMDSRYYDQINEIQKVIRNTCAWSKFKKCMFTYYYSW